MVILLPKVKSFGEEFGERFGGGLGQGISEGIEQRKLSKQQAVENQQVRQLTGMDFSGIKDPKMREQAFAELIKQKGKETRDLKKQDFLGKILGGQQQTTQPGQIPSEMPPGEEQISQGGFDPLQLSDADIARVTAEDPAIGRELRAAKNSALKQKTEQRKYDFEREKLGRQEETEISKPVLIEMNQIRKNIPLQEQAIIDIQQAAPNVSALDYFADVTGFEPLRSAEGAKLKTGIKDFFLSDLTRVGARPNQWIEQQLADALPKIGRSPEANLITAEGLKFKLDLAKKRVETIDKLSNQDRKKFGFVKGDIDSRAYNDMKKYVIDRQKELHDSIKKIKSQTKGKKNTVIMTSPEGSTYEIQSGDIDEALRHEFKFSE